MRVLNEKKEQIMWKSDTLRKRSKSRLLSGSKHGKFQEQMKARKAVIQRAREREDKENKERVETKPWMALYTMACSVGLFLGHPWRFRVQKNVLATLLRIEEWEQGPVGGCLVQWVGL